MSTRPGLRVIRICSCRRPICSHWNCGARTLSGARALGDALVGRPARRRELSLPAALFRGRSPRLRSADHRIHREARRGSGTPRTHDVGTPWLGVGRRTGERTGHPLGRRDVIELDELTAGQRAALAAAAAISRTTLALFAGASGDHNPIHIDIDAARAAGEPDVFAHGMLSMAYLGTLLTEHLPQSALRAWTVRFSARTPVHAQVTCRAVVQDVSGPVRAAPRHPRCHVRAGRRNGHPAAAPRSSPPTPAFSTRPSTGAGP